MKILINMHYKVVIQLNSSDYAAHKSMLDQISNLILDLDEVEVKVIVHGDAYPFLLKKSFFQLHIEDLQKRNVHFYLCENTMDNQNLIQKDMLEGVRTVSSGVAFLVKKQSEGWAYLKAG